MFKKILFTLCVALVGVAPVQAAWPERTVTLIVPWAPGGSTDILARMLSDYLTRSLGQTFIVENKAGASGNIGSNLVAKAKPDGYTLLVGSMSTHAMNQALFSSMPFEPVDDFTPISLVAFVTNTLVINPKIAVNNVAELIAYAIQMTHIPYKGGAPAVLDTVAGQTEVLFGAGTQTLPHVKSGKLKLLAVTESTRSPQLPDTPTVAETLPGYELVVWYGAFGPKDLPKEITERLSTEINRIVALPEVRTKMSAIGVEVVSSTPAGFAKTLQQDAAKFTKLIRELKITAE